MVDFTSAKIKEETEEEGLRDNLDEVYGTPSRSSTAKKERSIRAFTIQEMIKANMDNMINNIKMVIGDKNAS